MRFERALESRRARVERNCKGDAVSQIGSDDFSPPPVELPSLIYGHGSVSAGWDALADEAAVGVALIDDPGGAPRVKIFGNKQDKDTARGFAIAHDGTGDGRNRRGGNDGDLDGIETEM